MFKYFTPQQANKALPDVKKKFDRVIAIRDQILDMQEELDRMIQSNATIELYMKKKQELKHSIPASSSCIARL